VQHLPRVLWLSTILVACSPDSPSLVEGPSPVDHPGSEGTAQPWIGKECLAQDTEQALTLGLLFETQQSLMLDVDNGGRIVTWPGSTPSPPSGMVAIDPVPAQGTYVEGSQSLCAHVTGKAGWQIHSKLAHTADVTSRMPVNLQDFTGGYLEFELLTDAPVAVTVDWLSTGKAHQGTAAANEYAHPSRFGGAWRTVRIPLCSFQRPDLAQVLSPVGLFPLFQTATASSYVCADAIRWIRPGSCPASCK
jgi:hypothetical protein